MKRMRKITALLLATVMVAGSGSIPNNLTSVKAAEAESSSADLSNYLTVYEDFDIEGYDYNLEGNYFKDIRYVDTMPTLENRSAENKWAKYVNNNGYGYWHKDVRPFDAPLSDYNGFAAYVKAETSVTFNFTMRSPKGLSRTISNPALDYTLITKDGKKSTGTGKQGIPIAAGFEGWVVIAKEEMTVAGGWDAASVKDSVDHDAFFEITNLNQIQAFVPELTNLNNGAVYVDDFAFVKDCDSFISYMAPPSVYDYLNVYEDFDGYDQGSGSYVMDYDNSAYGPTTTVSVMERNITGNKWLKYDGNNGSGHKYVEDLGTARTGISGKPGDYDGFAAYVSTKKGATFNIRFQFSYEYITRTAMNPKIPYTLITKDGVKTTGTGAYGIPLPEGFEGWIIMNTKDFKAAYGYKDAWTSIANSPDWNNIAYLNQMAVEITNSSDAVYVDDISFVTKTEDMINYLAPDKATAEDYLVMFEDFESLNDGANYALDVIGIGAYDDATATVKKCKGGGNWLKISGNNTAGHLYSPSSAFATANDVQGAAMYVKTESSATLNLIMRAGGLTRTCNNNNLHYTLISKDGLVKTKTEANGANVEAGFEGWIVFDKDAITTAAPGWETNSAFYGIENINSITVFAPEITNTTGAVYVDNLSYVMNLDAFVNVLKVDRPSHFVKYYETFDCYEVGKDTYALDDKGNDFFESKTSVSSYIESKGLTDKWMKVNGNNNVGHIYGTDHTGEPTYGWPRTDFSAKAADYNGISFEVKSEFDANLNLRLRYDYQAISRTATNGSLKYTLIAKDGTVTNKQSANKMEIPAGFEGIVVLKNDAMTPASGYTGVWEKFETIQGADLKLLNEFAIEVQTEGAVYLDNYAFITDVDKYVASFKNQTYTYGTGDMNEDGIVDDYDVMLARKYLVSSKTKMLNLDGKNEKGFAVSDKDNQKDIKSYNSFAIYVKTDSTVALNMAIRYTYIVQETVAGESQPVQKFGLVRTGIQDLKWDPASIDYSLLSVNGTKLEKTTTGKMEVPAGFEGWVLFGLDKFNRNPGYEAVKTMKDVETDVNFQYISPVIVDANGKVNFNIAQIALVLDKTDMIATWKNGKSVAGYLNTIEDFESQPSGKFDLNFADTGTTSANAKITKFGKFAQSSYDYNKDNKIGSADIVRLKKMAADMIEESGISLDNELVQNTSVWNTPGLAEDKDFQFDVEATSTWISVKATETDYYNALKKYNVGETKSLLPEKAAGEWGYSLVQLDGEVDGSGKKIESTFKVPPTSDADALEKMEQFISKQYGIDTKNDKWVAMNGYYPWYHYAAEFGASVVSTEIGENQNNYQMHMAFVRGAGRQYHLPWGIDFSMWHQGYMYNPNSYDGWYKTVLIGGPKKTDENSGHSLSLLERSLVMGYMGGANSVVAEAGGAMSLKNNNGILSLTEYGKTLQKVYAFTEKVDAGTAYTPIGIVLNHNHGSYAGIKKSGYTESQKSFATFAYDDGDKMTYNLMESIWGEGAWLSGSKRGDENEKGLLVNNSAYGDSFDILLDNASLATLKSYPVLVLSGAFTGEDELTTEQIQMYKQYVNDGGTLILNKAYTSIFPAFTESMPYGDGEVIVYGEKDYDLTGIEEILKTQIAKYQPVKVKVTANGYDIQYMTSMKDNKLYVTLINNAGVTKEGGGAAKVEQDKTSTVEVQYTGTYNVTSVNDVYDGNKVERSGSAATVTVPAGGIAVLEFNLD